MKPYVKIDRKVLFEILDTILQYEGGYTDNTCVDDDCPYSAWPWDKDFLKKVKNIRDNS